MPFTVTMPKLSPTMEEGTIAKWYKKEGDKVGAGEVLIDVATDKATVEYNALDEGYLRKILVVEGSSATVNQPIAIFTETADENIDSYQPEGIAPSIEKPKEEESTKIKTEAKPSEKKREAVGMQQPAFVPEVPLQEYDMQIFAEPTTRIPASPLARKLAKDKGVDISTVKGSGPDGRVMSRDLDLAQPDTIAAFGRREMPTIMPGTFEEVALSPMRKTIGQRLQEAKTFIPHFYVHQTVNAEPIVEIREQLKNNGLKVTYNDFVIRACALALREHMEVNCGYNSVNQSTIEFKTIDISIAVTVEGGLITPIVRYADYKNLGQISQEVKFLAGKAKEGKLEPHEYKGGSFTISNLGMFGISDFVAVINPPQSCILAVGGIEEVPVVRNGLIVPGKTMKITLSTDHRVVDGAEAAKFIKTVQKFLENPSILLVS